MISMFSTPTMLNLPFLFVRFDGGGLCAGADRCGGDLVQDRRAT